jgi:uracil-DNA glycosylase family 4
MLTARPRIVPPTGPKNAKIAFIGEAPSTKELQKLEPFVGSAGEVFNRCLAYVGLTRSEVYITNLFKFKVHKIKGSGKIYDENKTTLLYDPKKGFTDEAQPYIEELLDELDDLKVNILVPMGAPATLAITGKTSIAKWRGSILETSYCSKVEHKVRKAIPTIHPAHALYGAPLDKYKIAADFKKAMLHSNNPLMGSSRVRQVFYPKPDFNETIRHLKRYYQLAEQGKRINFDIEILNGQIDCISFAIDRHEAVSVSLSEWNEQQELEVAWELAKIFELQGAKLCNQNILFDITVLGFKNNIICPVTTQRLDDPMTAFNIIYPDFPKSLAFLTSIKTDLSYYKDDGKVFTSRGIGKIGGSIKHREYNCQDSCASIWCMEELDDELDQLGYRKQYEDTMRLYPVLATMMLHGVRVDHKALEEVKEELNREVIKYQEELDSLVGYHLNVNSSKQCQDYFYTTLGNRPFTKDNKITTDEKAMARLAKGTANRAPVKEANLVLQIRKINKLLSVYFSAQTDHDGRLRCSYNPRGTTSGRLSSSQTIFGTGMNMQNVPENFRRFIIPDEGYIFAEIDKRQAEWVVTAYLANDARMMEVHEKGLDAHVRTAELITGLPEELIIEENKLLKHETDPDTLYEVRKEKLPDLFKYAKFLPKTMTCRQAGKKTNHGLNYGMGYSTFSMTNLIPEDDSKIMVNKYHEGYPGIRNNYFAYVQRMLNTTRTLENLFGHKRRFLEPYSQNLLNKAYDYCPQSTVGWIVNYAMIDIYNDRDPILKDVEIMTQTHDSILLQIPLALKAEGISKAIELCCRHLDPELEFQGRTFHIGTDIKVGYNWGECVEIRREDNTPAKIKDALKL